MMINPAAGVADFAPPAALQTGVQPAERVSTQSETQHIAKEQAQPDTPTRKQVEEAAAQIESFTQNIAQNLKFTIDEETGKTVVKILDTQTQEIIRQIPSEEAINIARALGKIEGLLFNDKA